MGKSSYLCSWKTLRLWSMQDSEMRQSRAGLHRIGNWRDTFHYCSLEKAVRGRWKEWNTKQKLPLSSWWWQNILSFLWWGPEGETKVKQRRVKKGSRSGGACRVGSRDGLSRLPEQRERPGSPCWNTEVREKSSSVQGPHFGHFCSYSRESGLCLFPEHLPVWNRLGQKLFTFTWFPDFQSQFCKYVWQKTLIPTFNIFFDCGLKSGVYKLIKQTQTVVTFQLIQVVKF